MQTYLWKHSHVPITDLPEPMKYGWRINIDGEIEPLWSTSPAFSKDMVDLLSDVTIDQNTAAGPRDAAQNIITDDQCQKDYQNRI